MAPEIIEGRRTNTRDIPKRGIKHYPAVFARALLFAVSAFLFFPAAAAAFCLPCAGINLSGSSLNIGERGYGWLIPDEQSDITINPAYAASIKGKRLFTRATSHNHVDNTVMKNSGESLSGGIFVLLPFGQNVCSLKYAPSFSKSSEKYKHYSSDITRKKHDNNFELSLSAGFPFKKDFDIGITAGITKRSSLSSTAYNNPGVDDLFSLSLGRSFFLKAGVIFKTDEDFYFGASLGGLAGKAELSGLSGPVSADDSLSLNIVLLSGLSLNEDLLLRAGLGLNYESVLTSFFKNGSAYYEDETYYYTDINGGLGLFHTDPYGPVSALAVKAKWVPEKAERTFVSGRLNTAAESGFYTDFFAAYSQPVFNNKTFLTIGYEFLKLSAYSRAARSEISGFLISKGSSDYFDMTIFPDFDSSMIVSLGINPYENLFINLGLGGSGLSLAASPGSNSLKSLGARFEAEVNFIFE
ncbi:MAG TPA: hypothetical protein ENN43_03370 [bacterium]|nr:hypothetical protein [bacterium]